MRTEDKRMSLFKARPALKVSWRKMLVGQAQGGVVTRKRPAEAKEESRV